MFPRTFLLVASLIGFQVAIAGNSIEEREKVRADDPVLFSKIAEIMFQVDPEGINFESNTDEYEPEAGTVIPQLSSCKSEQDVLRVVNKEFSRWFGTKPKDRVKKYKELAGEIWKFWIEHKEGQ